MPIRFYLHTKTYSDGRRPIYLDARWGRSTVAGQNNKEARLRTSTGKSCQPNTWDADKERVKTAEPDALAINRALGKLRVEADKHLERAELEGTTLSAEQLLVLLKPNRNKEARVTATEPTIVTMASLFADWQQAHRARRAEKTLSGPKGLIDQLERFRPGITPDDLQPNPDGRCPLLEEFCVFCIEQATNRTGEIGLFNNTISSYLKRLRKLLKFGRYEFDWIDDDFSEEVEREPLTFEEVMRLYRQEPPEFQTQGARYVPRVHIRDVFVFNCLTGPRYGSLATLQPSDVTWERIDETSDPVPVLGYYAYKNRRNKRKVRVPLDPIALEIWERYNGQLPVPSNSMLNECIKPLCRAAGLKRLVKVVRGSGAKRQEQLVPLWQDVSCHTARYTYITMQNDGGNDIASIQDSVGHADINTTRRYIKTRAKARFAAGLQAFATLRQQEGTPGTPTALGVPKST